MFARFNVCERSDNVTLLEFCFVNMKRTIALVRYTLFPRTCGNCEDKYQYESNVVRFHRNQMLDYEGTQIMETKNAL